MLEKIPLQYGLGLREFCAEDQPFGEVLFNSTRESFYLMPMPRQQIDLLLKQQFILQTMSYAQHFPAAKTFIITLDGEAIGKIILNRTQKSVHIVDIAFVQKMRGKGYGTEIFSALKSFATHEQLPLQLAVDQQNIPAKRLYLRLGFTLVESSATHDTLIWG
jgi:RimJ/RimL family protein N-acetyltransferase